MGSLFAPGRAWGRDAAMSHWRATSWASGGISVVDPGRKLSDPSQPPFQEPLRECLATKIPSVQQENAAFGLLTLWVYIFLKMWGCGPLFNILVSFMLFSCRSQPVVATGSSFT